MTLDIDTLLNQAADLEAKAQAELDAGNATEAAVAIHQAMIRREAVKVLKTLTGRSDVVQSENVNALNLRISRTRSLAGAWNSLLQAIGQSPWRSARNYCKNRLGISPSSLTLYMTDKPVPQRVASLVVADFPELFEWMSKKRKFNPETDWQWPKGVVE